MSSRTRFLAFILLVGLSTVTRAQYDGPEGAGRGSLVILPAYGSWSDDSQELSQFSTVVTASYALSRPLSVSFRAGQAQTDGPAGSLNGFTDSQFGVSYHVESSGLIFSLIVNTPTGKRGMTAEEFEVDTLFRKEIFTFQIPRYGQGLNVHPAAAFAFPLSDEFVLGFGAGFQYMGSYQPLLGYGDYDPGDEVVLSGGFDVRVDEASGFVGDIVYSIYGKDTFEGEEVFQPGNKVLATLRYNRFFDYNELSLLARFRRRADGKIAVGNAWVNELNQPSPDLIDLTGQYKLRLTGRLDAAIHLDVRWFHSATSDLYDVTLFGGGFRPELEISTMVRVLGFASFWKGESHGAGTLTGWDLGLGVGIRF
jgi:hypothetical protein